MKKLMIALAAVAVGCMAQASTVTWGFDEIVDADGNLITEAPAQQIVLCVMGDNGWEKFAEGETGYIIDDGVAMWSEDTNKSYTQFAGKQFTMMLDDGAGNLSKINLYGGGTYDTVLSVAEDIQSNWKDMSTLQSTTPMLAQSVPEPTSGLLLLLGVAGLALRRRRA